MNQVAYESKVGADSCSPNIQSVTYLINIKLNTSIESDSMSANNIYQGNIPNKYISFIHFKLTQFNLNTYYL